MKDVFGKLEKTGIIPVIKLDNADDVLPLADALLQGGIDVAEITFRTAAAEQAITLLKKNCPEMTIGAGTVLTIQNANKAYFAGAEFIVAPGFNPTVVDHCVMCNIPMAPGCSTPSEIELAMERGLRVVKFFPAEQSGGLSKIKAMASAYGDVKFIPTGGIDLENLAKYAAFPKILACGGTFMVKDSLIINKQWSEITRLSVAAREIIASARG